MATEMQFGSHATHMYAHTHVCTHTSMHTHKRMGSIALEVNQPNNKHIMDRDTTVYILLTVHLRVPNSSVEKCENDTVVTSSAHQTDGLNHKTCFFGTLESLKVYLLYIFHFFDIY